MFFPGMFSTLSLPISKHTKHDKFMSKYKTKHDTFYVLTLTKCP